MCLEGGFLPTKHCQEFSCLNCLFPHYVVWAEDPRTWNLWSGGAHANSSLGQPWFLHWHKETLIFHSVATKMIVNYILTTLPALQVTGLCVLLISMKSAITVTLHKTRGSCMEKLSLGEEFPAELRANSNQGVHIRWCQNKESDGQGICSNETIESESPSCSRGCGSLLCDFAQTATSQQSTCGLL